MYAERAQYTCPSPTRSFPISPSLSLLSHRPLQPGHERYRLSAELSRLLKLPREEKASRLQTALLDLVRSRELFALPAPVPAEMVASTSVVAYILCDPDLQKLVGLQKVHLAALIPRLTQQGTPHTHRLQNGHALDRSVKSKC
jgi:hypothetical protein